MIPFLIISGIVLLFIATKDIAAPQTVDAAASSYTAPALQNSVPVVHSTRHSSMRTDSGKVTTSTNPVSLGNHTGSVLDPIRPRDVTGISMAPVSNYVAPPANNPVISRPEVRPIAVVAPEPRTYTAPVSVFSKMIRR